MVSDLRLSMYATDRTKKEFFFLAPFSFPTLHLFYLSSTFFYPSHPKGSISSVSDGLTEREREKERKKAGLSPSRAGRRAFYIRLLLLLLLQTFDITQDRKEKGKREGGLLPFSSTFFYFLVLLTTDGIRQRFLVIRNEK